MKKFLLYALSVVMLFSLLGCGNSEQKNNETIPLDTPEGITQEFFRLVSEFEYGKTSSLFTEEYNNQFTTFGNFINEIKNYDKIDAEKTKEGPQFSKNEDSNAGLWYQYSKGNYVFFKLVKENEAWKISEVSLWSEKGQGSPEKATLE